MEGQSLKYLWGMCTVGGWPCDNSHVMADADKFFLQISGFSLIYINANNY